MREQTKAHTAQFKPKQKYFKKLSEKKLPFWENVLLVHLVYYYCYLLLYSTLLILRIRLYGIEISLTEF